MASTKRKKNQPGSAQVGDWRFTYQDRIRSFQNVGLAQGDGALSAYAVLFGRVERDLFSRFCAGASLSSLKNEHLVKYRIPARMFNSLRVSLEGKISAVRESIDRHIESLETRIKRAEAQIAAAIEWGNLNTAHQKKRRLAILAGRLVSVLFDKASGRVRLCFGSKKLWRKQYHLEVNGYASLDEWREDWRAARSDEFFVLGSKDETSGCQLCVATVQDDGLITLRLRLPDALTAKHGKYLVIQNVHFHNGHAQVLAALQGEEGQAVSYRFKLDGKGWRVFASVKHQPVSVVTNRRLGAIGVDVNTDHLAVSEADYSGNWLRSWTVPLVTYGKTAKQTEALIGDAVAEVVALARAAGKPLVIENLDFSKKKDQLEAESPGGSRMLSSFAYGKIKTHFLSRGYREGVEVVEVNPAFSSVMGRVLFMERYGVSVDQAAALVLARRLLNCSEGIPDHGNCPDGYGGHVAFRAPALGRKRVKHVWTLWGMLWGQLKPALAERHRRVAPRCTLVNTGVPPPVRAGPQDESGLGCEQIGVSGWESRDGVALCCWGGERAASAVRLELVDASPVTKINHFYNGS